MKKISIQVIFQAQIHAQWYKILTLSFTSVIENW